MNNFIDVSELPSNQALWPTGLERLRMNLGIDPAELVEAIKGDKDLYSFMASKMFKVPYERCGRDTWYRMKAKEWLLGILYTK